MSFQAMAWAIKQEAGDPASRLLLLILANYADDTGKAWPSQKTLVKQTGMSERSVRNHTDWLAEHGFITVETHKHAGGTKLTYQLVSEPPAKSAGGGDRQNLPVPPARSAADPINEPTDEPTPRAERLSRLPRGWEPTPEILAWARTALPNVSVADELEKFRDHFLANGERKLRWDYAFRNWLRRSVAFSRAPVVRAGRLSGADLDARNRQRADQFLRDLADQGTTPATRLIG